jgi:hypothetical protein
VNTFAGISCPKLHLKGVNISPEFFAETAYIRPFQRIERAGTTMAPPSYTPYNPADHGPPSALLPEEVFGHVDVATLGDITRYLRESESQDDTELATWIQRNYLHGLRKDQSTATIRTPEGFAQLDRAYRRVRSLTNKAQDKWPFFDRNFKQMSTATVRNNARGEAAPGVLFNKNGMRRPSGLGEQPQASSTRNGVDTPKSE